MNHEDNERHYKAWLDKNSWRRDVARLEKEYGARRDLSAMRAKHEASDKASLTWREFFDPKSIWYHCPLCKEEGPKMCDCKPPHTDEFHFDAMSVIRYLGEALAYRPHLAKCPNCPAAVRVRQGDAAHLCTVCEEIRGSQ